MIDRLRRLFRAHLFRRDEAAHPDGWSLAEQLLGHRRDDEDAPSRYEPHPRWSAEAIAEADDEIDKRARRIAVAESRRKRESGVTPFRSRRAS